MALKPITVTQVNQYINDMFRRNPLLGNVTVIGEVSRVSYPASGHVYFSLLDGNSKLDCFLPSSRVALVPFMIQEGMEVIVTGSVTAYSAGSKYSLRIDSMEKSGEGALAIAFEQLKNRLQKEGLFDETHKKPLPVFPRHIGVVTSETGAAIRDILKIIRGRNTVVDVTVFPVLVQGEGASEDIASMIDFVNETQEDIDLLIVGRGGGSAEDLWAFNEEVVARAIYRSDIPIISGVGHEIDFTISDMVADRRAETPTAAAQMAVPDTDDLRDLLSDSLRRMQRELTNRIQYNKLLLNNIKSEMHQHARQQLEGKRKEVDAAYITLRENNPQRILANGYALLQGEDGHIIQDAQDLSLGASYDVILHRGSAKVRIEEIGGTHYGRDDEI